MAITLAEVRNIVGDAIDYHVIDEFRKNSYLLDNLVFDNLAAPTSGSGFVYQYNRQATQPTAAFRLLNADYTDQTVTTERHTVNCGIFGGSFTIDRVLASMGNAAEVALQMTQKAKAARALFTDTAINGNLASGTGEFDGLKVQLTGIARQEITPASVVDLTTIASASDAYKFSEHLDDLLSRLDSLEGAVILTNRKGKVRINTAARFGGYHSLDVDSFGQPVDMYNGVPIIDLGETSGGTSPVIPTDPATGTTDIYVVRLGIDGWHAVSPAGSPVVKAYLPPVDFGSATARGSVEFVAAVALKTTRAAAVLHNVKVDVAGATDFASITA
jgi:hypothetical protein